MTLTNLPIPADFGGFWIILCRIILSPNDTCVRSQIRVSDVHGARCNGTFRLEVVEKFRDFLF